MAGTERLRRLLLSYSLFITIYYKHSILGRVNGTWAGSFIGNGMRGLGEAGGF